MMFPRCLGLSLLRSLISNTRVSYESSARFLCACRCSLDLPVRCAGVDSPHSLLSATGERCSSVLGVCMPAAAAEAWPLTWRSWICGLTLEWASHGWSWLRRGPFWPWMFSALDLFSEKKRKKKENLWKESDIWFFDALLESACKRNWVYNYIVHLQPHIHSVQQLHIINSLTPIIKAMYKHIHFSLQ